MNEEDTRLLTEIKRLVGPYRDGRKPPLNLADQLAVLHDAVSQRQREGDHALNQHFVTLDSAATFAPKNESERAQVQVAVQTAVEQIVCLVDQKLLNAT